MNLESMPEQSAELKPVENQNHLLRVSSKHGRRKLAGKSPEWQTKIYGKQEKYDYDAIEFHKLSTHVFKIDEHKCQSCLKTRYKLVREDRYLTCHHIVPREDGGSDEFRNLITLCNKCHDHIEELKIKTREEIIGLLSDDKKHWHRKTNLGTEWQSWVYGGMKRPSKNIGG